MPAAACGRPAIAERALILAERLAAAAGRAPSEVRAFESLLAAPPGVGGGRSALNADGSPVQVCVTIGRDRWDVRLIGDPAHTLGDARARNRAARAAAARLAETRAPALAGLVDAAWSALLPDDADGFAPYVEGTAWLGMTVGAPGVAVYCDLTKGDAERTWARVARWIGDDAPLARLRALADPMSAGFEGVDPAHVRKKLYWRLRRATSLATLGIPLFGDASLAAVLARVLGSEPIDGGALVFACGFDDAGRARDVKIDVCAHCVVRPTAWWRELVAELIAALGLARVSLDAVVPAEARVSFVGYGVDAAGTPRLNIYLGGRS